MDSYRLEQLRNCCRDNAAFEQLKQFLTVDAAVPATFESKPDAQFLQLVCKTDDIFVEYDRELRYVWINPAGAARLGINLVDAIGKTNREIFGREADEMEVPVRHALESGQQVQVSHKIPLLIGTSIYHCIYTPVRDNAGTITGIIGVACEATTAIDLEKPLPQANTREGAHVASLQLQIEQYKILSEVITRIRKSWDLDSIFKASAAEVRNLLNADRVKIFRFSPNAGLHDGEFVCEDALPALNSALAIGRHDSSFGREYAAQYRQGEIQAISNIYNAGFSDTHIQILTKLHIRASLIVPLFMGEDLWGLLCVDQCSSLRHWQAGEIEFITQMAEHLGVALQHTQSIGQVQKAAKREKALATTIDKIRQSLDPNTIFKITTDEVRQLLQADRVAVYQFNSDWYGEFVAESVAAGWNQLVGTLPIIEDTHLQETQGGRYRNHETLAIDDIYTAGHRDCHIALLEQFQAKAYVIVPIFEGEKLWGLLAAYQNSGARHWEADEIELLVKIGAQFGVALQQAQLLAQTRHQAEELTQTLRYLQQTQRMMQTEKLASLGQLVAGVAHEISNPINFISGNLSHTSDYSHNLLELVRLYQQHYPLPASAIQDYLAAIEFEFIQEDLPSILSSMGVGAKRIQALVLSLQKFSQVDQAQKKPVNIHEGIDTTLLLLQHRLKAKTQRAGIEVVKEYGDLPAVKCFAAQINQVFMNILSNAIDSLETVSSQRTISIRTSLGDGGNAQQTGSVVIRICDNGPGIPDALRQRIFDAFFTTKQAKGATGMGLFISYQIVVENHGGTLKCVSVAGEGTEFWIEIPIDAK
ncbi:GAF domain-containing protein [Microcoleus sp. FACHB-672]|uniref:GAF domain-containing sensor histidine kinase n=1 Tax=Microcoleus sp. FACHB-672 TaxID=2692825 RepID=UPI0016897BD7|nr:GAF domain-containing protein [Microcoleus sp. FACHB-672]MBD2043037.1 GAF domain-containing protein [Microcoleus sp. FACHB-672]